MTVNYYAITGIITTVLSYSVLEPIITTPELWGIVGVLALFSVVLHHYSPLPNHNASMMASPKTQYDKWGWK